MRSNAVVILFAMLVVPAVHAQHKGTLYRWTDEKGVVHFGDHVPPATVKEERDVLDAHGEVTKVLPREKSQAEIEQETKARQQVQQATDYDNSLLRNYATVSEIEKLRDDRLATFDLRLQQAQKQVDDTQATLTDLRAHAHADSESAQGGDEPADPDIERQIATYESALSENYNALSKLRADRQRTADQFGHDIERFKQLKGIKSSPATAKPNG